MSAIVMQLLKLRVHRLGELAIAPVMAKIPKPSPLNLLIGKAILKLCTPPSALFMDLKRTIL
jgi:hypothetical protein